MVTIAQKFEPVLIKKIQVAADSFSFYFQRPDNLDFLPGQFMRLTLEIEKPDDRGNYRLFSIASSPTEKEFLMITTHPDHSEFKKTLFEMNLGNKVQISAPYGMFILKPEIKTPRVFLAGGIGITPFRSMIRYASDTDLQIPITLFNSFSTVEEIIFQKELQEIASKKSWFRLVETITKPEESKTVWKGNVGRIDVDLIKKNVPDLNTPIFYIAGPPAMVEALDSVVRELGVEEPRVQKEKFTGY